MAQIATDESKVSDGTSDSQSITKATINNNNRDADDVKTTDEKEACDVHGKTSSSTDEVTRILPGTQLDDVIPTKLEREPIENRLLKLNALENEITSEILAKYNEKIKNYTNWPSFMVICFVIAYRHVKNKNERKKVTLEKFDKFISFYDKSKFDSILSIENTINEYNLTIKDGAFKGLPLYMYGLDREGHPIYWQDGVCFVQLFETFKNNENTLDLDKFDTYNAINWRRLFNLKLKLSQYYNSTLFYHLAVVDCSTMPIFETLDQFRKYYTFYLQFFGLTNDLFPENVYKIIMINAPFAFKISFNIVKKVLNHNTQQKILVFGTDYLDKLLKYIDIDMIPPKHKGKGKWNIRMGNVPETFALQTDHPFLPVVK